MIPDDPSLQSFGLIWRFSDAEKYTQLSEAEFRRFSPLSEGESLRQWEQHVYPDATPRHRHLGDLFVQRLIKWPETPSFTSESHQDGTNVVPNLQRRIVACDSDEVVFFWHAEMAARTDWRLFLDHWDDFCYPSDDSNILVLPMVGKAVAYIEERWYVFDRQTMATVFEALRT
jgi:hypothetical protein